MIYNNSDIWIGRSIDKYGEFSESEVQVFQDILKPGHVVFDIGANIGCHSVAFSRLVGPSGVVFSYEPERNNFTTLAGNIAINNLRNVHVFQKAVGSTSGLIAVPEIDVDKTVNFGGLSLIHDYSVSSHYPVPLITLDEYNYIRCDLIKIDVEGMEKLVLQGSQETIKKNKPILYLENDREEKSKDLIEYIKSLDYVVYKHLAPFFNPNNYFGDKENVFVNENNFIVVSSNIYCHHKSIDSPIDTKKFAMELI
jgi:FkbM family methyltransferase